MGQVIPQNSDIFGDYVEPFLYGMTADFWGAIVAAGGNPPDAIRADALVQEECREFFEAVRGDYGDAEVVKELCDVIYTAMQAILARGYHPDWALELVHRSNLGKFRDASFGPDGKLNKGPHYTPPNLDGAKRIR